jgi:hypothetical protein
MVLLIDVDSPSPAKQAPAPRPTPPPYVPRASLDMTEFLPVQEEIAMYVRFLYTES